MEDGTFGLLESVTLKSLHACNFSRSSSEASHVLTDLLSRYLTLVASTCAQYAEHAGRSTVSTSDVLLSLGDMGVTMNELKDFADGEGREMARYANRTARRAEELAVLKETLADGLRQSRNDTLRLVYAEISSPGSSTMDEEEIEESFGLEEFDEEEQPVEAMNGNAETRVTTPPLPPSPISNPPSPPRKRARTTSWNPPSHVPDFLPPFPNISISPPPSPSFKLEADQMLPPTNPLDRPLTPPPQLSTSTTTSDYLTPVPYSMSSLSTSNEYHLPDRPSSSDAIPQLSQKRKYEPPQIAPSLVKAYHHVLINKAPAQPTVNPLRHRVALSLLTHMYTNPKWTAADTLYGNLATPRARAVAPAPVFPVSEDAMDDLSLKDGGKPPLLPPPVPRPVAMGDTFMPLSIQPTSRIPDIARSVLPLSVYNRTTRILPPPLQVGNSGQKFTYGYGIPAPWNSTVNSLLTVNVSGKDKGKDRESLPNGKGKDGDEKDANSLPDAKLYATWPLEVHDFRQPIAPHMHKRGRLGSFSFVGASSGSGPPQRPNLTIRSSSESTSFGVTVPSRKGLKATKDGKGK